MPEVSIILTSHNHAKFIAAAIDSVLNQTFKDFELYIWDDASTDESWEIISQYDDPRVFSFRNDEKKMAIYGVRKFIQKLASGKYIAMHHSDDVWDVNKLQIQVDFLNANSNYGAVFSGAQLINESGEPFVNQDDFPHFRERENRTRFEWLRYLIEVGNPFCHPSLLIRKECYKNCGLYRYSLRQLADFDMWVRLCLKYEVYVLSDNLVQYRLLKNYVNASSKTSDAVSRVNFEKYIILKTHLANLSASEISQIFPEMDNLLTVKNFDTDYVLAMAFIEYSPSLLLKAYALELLFTAVNDESRAENIKKVYGFDYLDLIKLTTAFGGANVTVHEHEKLLQRLNGSKMIGPIRAAIKKLLK